MKNYKAVIKDSSTNLNGQIIANTKTPSRFKGMNRIDFETATKFISVYNIEIVEI